MTFSPDDRTNVRSLHTSQKRRSRSCSVDRAFSMSSASAGKRVTNAVRGSDKSWRLRLVPNRPPQLTNQHREIGLDHERLGPDLPKELRFRHHVWPPRHQGAQELERLGRQMHLLALAQKLPGFRIKNELAETGSHNPPGDWKILGTFL